MRYPSKRKRSHSRTSWRWKWGANVEEILGSDWRQTAQGRQLGIVVCFGGYQQLILRLPMLNMLSTFCLGVKRAPRSSRNEFLVVPQCVGLVSSTYFYVCQYGKFFLVFGFWISPNFAWQIFGNLVQMFLPKWCRSLFFFVSVDMLESRPTPTILDFRVFSRDDAIWAQ